MNPKGNQAQSRIYDFCPYCGKRIEMELSQGGKIGITLAHQAKVEKHKTICPKKPKAKDSN
jgi:hypothetical protein